MYILPLSAESARITACSIEASISGVICYSVGMEKTVFAALVVVALVAGGVIASLTNPDPNYCLHYPGERICSASELP